MSGRAEARVVVDRLSKSFRDARLGLVHAVDEVSFEARPGEVFALLGPNGAGKTTTLRMLCTVLKPTGGTARVAGFDVATQADRVRQNIGYMSMNTALYDRMSAWEMVAFFGRLHGMEPEPLRQRM
ncbi:MAG: ATP-binding cassette domain-containing protein, partial [Gemmataceae bacterium]